MVPMTTFLSKQARTLVRDGNTPKVALGFPRLLMPHSLRIE
jgi:hypothetical protein